MIDSDEITPCITLILHCVSDINVSFEDVFNLVTKNPNMLYIKS